MAHAPENTMKAFRLGIEMGADMVELDAHLTRDGHAVIHHDRSFGNTTPKKGLINLMTLNSVRELRFQGEPIPTLEEALLLCKEHGTILNIECKQGTAIKEVVRLVRLHGMERLVMVSQFSALVLWPLGMIWL